MTVSSTRINRGYARFKKNQIVFLSSGTGSVFSDSYTVVPAAQDTTIPPATSPNTGVTSPLMARDAYNLPTDRCMATISKHDKVESFSVVWSPCGEQTMLVIEPEVRNRPFMA